MRPGPGWKKESTIKKPLTYIENSIGMGSFCDGSIIFFRSDYLVTDLVTIIIHRKRSFSLLQAVLSERRRGEQDLDRVTQRRKKTWTYSKLAGVQGHPVWKCVASKQSYHYCTTPSIVLQEQTVHTGIHSPVSYTSLKKNWKIFEKGLSYTYNVSRICIVYACSIAR